MKRSSDLSKKHLATVDKFQKTSSPSSPPTVIQYAIRQLPRPELERAYEQAREEWDNSDDATL